MAGDNGVADRLTCRLALNRIPGVGPAISARLYRRFGDAKAVFQAPAADLSAVLSGVPNQHRIAEAIRAGPDTAATLVDRRWLDAAPERRVLCPADPEYPALLAGIADPPPLLFVAGSIEVLNAPQVAVVGSRSCTALGRELARELAGDLAQAGLAVTSGLASGIDSAAHSGALQPPGSTLAVCGNGLDSVYPRSAAPLARHILDSGGALVSEFSIGVKPHPSHFPRRNRIISGLALGTVVVEADLNSGSLITARLAAEQGRQVFAVPGSVRNQRARGCHALIREGATLIQNAAQVIEALAPQLGALLDAHSAVPDRAAPAEAQDPFLKAVGLEPFSVDDAVAATGLTAAAVSTKLLRYELEGVIAPGPGGRYTRLK